MRKSLLVVVVLLCVASLMAAMAYTRAEVHNDAKMRIVATNAALLRFDNYGAGPGEVGYTTGIENGMMWFDFTQGKDKAGFQPGSTYVYKDLFRIINNQPEGMNVNIQVSVVKCDIPNIWIYDRSGNVLVANGVPTGVKGKSDRYTVEFRIPKSFEGGWPKTGFSFDGEIVFAADTVAK